MEISNRLFTRCLHFSDFSLETHSSIFNIPLKVLGILSHTKPRSTPGQNWVLTLSDKNFNCPKLLPFPHL